MQNYEIREQHREDLPAPKPARSGRPHRAKLGLDLFGRTDQPRRNLHVRSRPPGLARQRFSHMCKKRHAAATPRVAYPGCTEELNSIKKIRAGFLKP